MTTQDYSPSEEERKRFGRLKYYGQIDKSLETRRRAENGRLVYVSTDGKESDVYGCYDLPWALLQYKKKQLINNNPFYNNKNLKLKNL